MEQMIHRIEPRARSVCRGQGYIQELAGGRGVGRERAQEKKEFRGFVAVLVNLVSRQP